MNIKRRVMAGSLGVLLLVSSPLQVSASSSSSATQGTTGVGASTSKTGNGTWNLNTKTGFRFTICDGAGNPVSNVYGQYDSLDVVNSGVQWGVGELWTACATKQETGLNNAGSVYPLLMSDFLSSIKESGHNFRWTQEGYAVFGDEVKTFILKGTEKIDSGSGNASNIGDGSGSSSITTTNGSYYNELPLGNSNIPVFSEAEERAVSSYQGMYSNMMVLWPRELESINSVGKAKELAGRISSLRGTLPSQIKGTITSAEYGDNYTYAQYKLMSDWNTYVGKIEDRLKQMYPEEFEGELSTFKIKASEFPSLERVNISYNIKDINFDKLNPFNWGLITVYASGPSTGSIGSGVASLPDGQSGTKANENSVLAKIINMYDEDVKQYVFQLDGIGEGKTPLQVFVDKGYMLLVENTIQGCPQGWTDGKAGASYKSLVYGTAHNWLVGFGNSSSFKNSSAYSNSFGNHVKALTQTLPNGLITDSDWIYMGGTPVLLKPSHTGKWTITDATAHMNEGFGCHLYTAYDLGGDVPVDISTTDVISDYNIIHTYNIKDNPEYDDYSESSTNKKDPEVYKEKSLHFSIDKHYRYRDAITGQVTEISYYTTKNAPHIVVIQDEREQTGFQLKDWFTSTDDWLPPDGGIPSDYNWENVVKGQHKNGQYAGTGETTLTVKPTDPDNVLHLLYEFEGKPFINIVKIYKNEDGSVNHTKGPEPHDDLKKYTVEEDEEGFTYVETLISKEEPDPNNPNGSSTKDKVINIPEGTKTLYIIYKAQGKQIILYSDELTYTYDLRDLVKERVLFGIYDKAPASPGTRPGCSGHGKYGRTCSIRKHYLEDSSFGLSVDNNYDYNANTTFILDYAKTDKGGASFSKKWIAQVSSAVTPGMADRVKPNGDFILYRQKDKDLVTLYPKKNTSLTGELGRLGISAVSYTPAGTRADKEMTKDKHFVNHFKTYFEYTSHDTSLRWNWSRAKCNTNRTGTYTTTAVATPQGANDFYSKNDENVKEYYFVGKTNSGLDTSISDTRPGDDAFVSKFKRNQSYAAISADLSFYPYAKMFYRAKNANESTQDVFVTSENLSSMKVFNVMQSGIYKKNGINANLTSTQWSTHARSLSFLKSNGVTDKQTVLPGGAIQDIDMGNKGDTQLGIRLYQACLPDGQVETVQEGFKVSETQAKQAANDLIEAVKKAIGGYGLVQWGIEGFRPDLYSVLTGYELHEDTSVGFVLGRGGKTSSDDKYYLRHDGSGSSRANFDCLDNRIEKQTLYTVYSDTDGNVWVTKNGSEIGRINLTQSASTLIGQNKELQLLDANTKLITNYVAALDRNKGEKGKYDRYDKHKYNEAFDGVSVLVTDISFDIGFGQGMSKRTNVLDTLLVAQADSKSDLYNFEDSKVRSSVYSTTRTSTAAEKQVDGYFATLKAVAGMGDLDIGISDIQSMAYTKNFFIPNATVSDLN